MPATTSPRRHAFSYVRNQPRAGSHRDTSGDLGAVLLTSIFLRHELAFLQRCFVVVGTLHRSLRQLNLLARDLLVGNEVQDVREAVEPGALLVIRTEDVPVRV